MWGGINISIFKIEVEVEIEIEIEIALYEVSDLSVSPPGPCDESLRVAVHLAGEFYPLPIVPGHVTPRTQ